MANKIRIMTNAAAPAMGTYSQAIRTGDLVFVTAQTGRNSETGKLEEGLEAQTRQMLSNVEAILNAAGMLLPAELRSLDAIHLVTARQLGSDLGQVITYDEGMAGGARLLRLRVATPR